MLFLVDAPNVRRSLWPNLSPERLVELLERWAAREGVRAIAVFDGPAPTVETTIELAGTTSESADDWIARRAGDLDEPFVLVTSDRELRRRVGGRAERVVGGGSFVRDLTDADA